MGDDREDLVSAFLEHFVDTHDGKESVGVELFAKTIEENGEVVMII